MRCPQKNNGCCRGGASPLHHSLHWVHYFCMLGLCSSCAYLIITYKTSEVLVYYHTQSLAATKIVWSMITAAAVTWNIRPISLWKWLNCWMRLVSVCLSSIFNNLSQNWKSAVKDLTPSALQYCLLRKLNCQMVDWWSSKNTLLHICYTYLRNSEDMQMFFTELYRDVVAPLI